MKNQLPKVTVTIPFVGEIISAFSRISWPTPREITLNLLAVLVISAIIGGYLWGLDTGFESLRNMILFK